MTKIEKLIKIAVNTALKSYEKHTARRLYNNATNTPLIKTLTHKNRRRPEKCYHLENLYLKTRLLEISLQDVERTTQTR